MKLVGQAVSRPSPRGDSFQRLRNLLGHNYVRVQVVLGAGREPDRIRYYGRYFRSPEMRQVAGVKRAHNTAVFVTPLRSPRRLKIAPQAESLPHS